MKSDPIQASRLIRTARGQLDGLLKMIEEDRYCIDIAHQISATQSILNRVKVDLLTAHIDHCVKASIQAQDQEDLDVKLEEIKTIIKQLAKN